MIGRQITGVILAGGRSTRMGQDKGLVEIDGQPLFAYIGRKLELQVKTVLVSCNRHQDRYAARYPTISDVIPDFAGPLSGMLAGLIASETEWVVFVPCDAPAFPEHLVARLWEGKGLSLAAYAEDANRAHPALCLLHKSLIPVLEDYLTRGERKVMLFFKHCHAQPVRFDKEEYFSNLNTPDEVAAWQNSMRTTP
ncbi:molybdenum cofactor guanylyltransferase MobA [Rouxiella chamberiensis]|uniref:molybdenum cofactor guanylyltransferase MobA n=1 Tax=Rouxiella chamberiensis TaxID=1513468 RepID=UPI0005D44D31